MDFTILITIASLIGTIANVYKKRYCFKIWLVTNFVWCIYDFQKGLYSQALLFLIYFIMAIVGIRKWRADNENH